MRTLRKRSVVLMIALLAVLGLSSAASALTIDLVWTGSGGDLTPSVGTLTTGSSVVTLEIYAVLKTPPGLSGIQMSVSYDAAALSVSSCTPYSKAAGQYAAGGFFQPAMGKGAVCDTSVAGIVAKMDQQAYSVKYLPTKAGSVHVADIVFHVIQAGGGPALVSSFFDTVFDGWGSNNYVFSLVATQDTATVNIIPEPTTAILLGAGFLGLLAAGRRKR